MSKTARVLVTLYLAGQVYAANTVLQLDDKLAKSLEKEGSVDTNPDAVAYCTVDLGQTVIKHQSVANELAELAEVARVAEVARQADIQRQADDFAKANPPLV